MELKKTLLAGLAVAALTVPTLALAASTPASTQSKPVAREDEPKSAEAAENAVTERSATFDGHQLAKYAKISLATARATALATRPGEITDQELEQEKGGSGLRYSFDVKSGTKVYEVGVDAKTGTVLENAIEGPNPD